MPFRHLFGRVTGGRCRAFTWSATLRGIDRRSFLEHSALAPPRSPRAPRSAPPPRRRTSSATAWRRATRPPTRCVLWTRVTPTRDATPGSGLGPATTVGWEVASDPGFVHSSAPATSSPTRRADHTVKVDVDGLAPYTRYWYRFTALGETSPVGRTRTAPAERRRRRAALRRACRAPTTRAGTSRAYRHARRARRPRLRAPPRRLHLRVRQRRRTGPGRASAASTTRAHEMRHARPTTAGAHALLQGRPRPAGGARAATRGSSPSDDHEVADDSWDDGADNHQPRARATTSTRRARGLPGVLRVDADPAARPAVDAPHPGLAAPRVRRPRRPARARRPRRTATSSPRAVAAAASRRAASAAQRPRPHDHRRPSR